MEYYISEDLVCNDMIDIRALVSIVVDIGDLECISKTVTSSTIIYSYRSTAIESIEQLHIRWIHYLQTGRY